MRAAARDIVVHAGFMATTVLWITVNLACPATASWTGPTRIVLKRQTVLDPSGPGG